MVLEGKIGVCFKLDHALHAKLIAEAKRGDRSLARELTRRLRRSIELEQEQPEEAIVTRDNRLSEQKKAPVAAGAKGKLAHEGHTRTHARAQQIA